MSSISSSSPYRVQGPVISVAELARTRPGMVTSATQAQIDEEKLHQEQFQARLAAVEQYAAQHPDKPYAQVIVDSKVVATVYESGSTYTREPISGLTEDGSGIDLAKQRLADILRQVKGAVIYSDFLPSPGGGGATMPESVSANLPAVTARGLNAMVNDMSWLLARSRPTVADSSKK